MTMDNDDPARDMYRYRSDILSQRGSGHPLVLSHGTLMDRTMFGPQIEALKDNYRTISYNLRARTDRYQSGYDLYDLVEDLDVLIDVNQVDKPVHIGMSMGGYIGLRYALEYPDKLSGLVLIDSAAWREPEDNKEQYREYIDQLRGLERPSDPLLDIAASTLFGFTTQNQNEELVERWKNKWSTYPGEAIANEMNSWLDRDKIRDKINEIDLPVLSIHGEEDAAIPIEHAEETVKRIPAAELEPIPEAGHTSNLEKPYIVNDKIEKFLAERIEW